jgi:uncharacterized iron-regulated protein
MKHKGLTCLLPVSVLPLFLIVVGCSVSRPAGHRALVDRISGRFFSGQIIHLETGNPQSFDALIEQLESKDLVFLGEVHSNPDHHLIQVQILQALMTRHGSLTLAMEAFQESQQTDIDRYMAGLTTEAEFLDDIKWRENWGFDYHLYRPLLLLVREKQGRILGINAADAIVKKVARQGLNSLEPVERRQLANHIDLTNERHREYVREAYKMHAHGDLKNFEYFYQAQCVWEDTMAENIAENLRENSDKMIVIAGNGHIIHKFGIPDRTLERVPVSLATVVLQPLLGLDDLEKGAADYVWFTGGHSGRGFMKSKEQGVSHP